MSKLMDGHMSMSMTTPTSSKRRPCTCSCGAKPSPGGSSRTSTSSGPSAVQVNPHGRTAATPASNNLDASFVYLPPAPSSASGAGDILLYQIESSLQHGGAGGDDASAGGLASAARNFAHLADMLVEGRFTRDGGDDNDDGDGDGDTCLCRACLERVTRAIDADTERYERETAAYIDAVTAEEDRERQIKQNLLLNAEVAAAAADDKDDSTNDQKRSSGDDLVKDAALNFESEVATLQGAVKEYQEELSHLDELMKEQVQRAAILSREEDLLFMDQNDIEIDAKEFENVSRQLTARCTEAHREAVALSKVNLHSALFDIVVGDDCDGGKDNGGPHTPASFPRINGMRLGHRPRFDLGWAEINCAWASAAQLLLFIASSVKYTSEDLRIVPMSSCAKIMEIRGSKKYVHNLGMDLDQGDGRNGSSSSNGSHRASSSRPRPPSDHLIMIPAIRAFNAMLSQVFEHLLKQRKTPKEEQPFKISRTTIGPHDLMRLHEEDGPNASAVIFCIAKNLKWLAASTSG